MSNFLVSFIFALGSGAWVYNKVMQRNGGQAKQALTAAGVCGVIAMIVFFTIISAATSRFS